MSEIALYGAPECKECEEIKEYLISHNIPFIYSEVGKDVVIEHLELVVSRRVYELPVITVNGTEVSFDYIKQSMEFWEQKTNLTEMLEEKE